MRARVQGEHLEGDRDIRARRGTLERPLAAKAWGAAAVVALSAGLLTACAGEGDSPDDAAGTAADAVAEPANESDEVTEGTEDGEDSGEDDADESSTGVASGTAQWQGETYEYDSVMCQDQSQFGQFNMIANGPDAPTLGVQITLDSLDDPDYSQPTSVELFFSKGGTIGEGEGYESPYGAVEGATSSTDGASGSVHLDPDESTTAPDVNPDGGQLDFEITCG